MLKSIRGIMKSQDIKSSEWESLDCPFCRALFRVNKNDLMPIDDYSFSCLSCKQVFWAKINGEQKIDVHSFKPSVEKQSEKTVYSEKICPHCMAVMEKGVVECCQCGRSFYDIQWMQNSPYSSFRLRKLFETLLADYDSPEKHGEFVSACIKQENPVFGLYCYKRLIQERPKDQQARKMFEYLKNVSQQLFQPQSVRKPSQHSYLKGWIHGLVFCIVLILISLLFL